MSSIVRYGVISDTHGRLSPRVLDVFAGVQRIYHCGDIGAQTIAMELGLIAPLRAVAGNMDPWPLAGTFPEFLKEDAEFGVVAMSHGTRFSHSDQRIMQGLLHYFGDPPPRLLLFGHSHSPFLCERRRTLVLNPGSATLPHHGDPPSVAIVEFDPANDTLTARHVALNS